jgi:hypothetical protein
VTATAVQLESQSTSLGKVMQTKQIAELPILGRSVMQLVSVIPGVEAARPEQIAPLYWELHTTKRDRSELVFKLDDDGFPRG